MNCKSISITISILAFTFCLLIQSESTHSEDEQTFTNPIAESGQDPWVAQQGDEYFYCFSKRNRIWVSRAANLEDIGKATPAAVWTPPQNTMYSKELWAPELHYLGGKWYIYVAADDGDNHNHRMFVLEGTTQNPQDPFVFKGKVADSTDRWAIDATVLQMGDKLYSIWSGWEGDVNVQQNLYIAPMSGPLTISGPRVCISKPELDWELNGKPLINEGPEVLKNGDQVFIIYSASGSWTDDYCLGQLALTGEDPLDPNAWAKKPQPVFSRTENIFGPGHASFVKSPNGKENWIVYHSARYSGAGWKRKVNIQ
ncbi:glycoside hydrolase family 43 protein, partial [bacterium]|nr:glycoside hydrolase family 43 protein [bacterium]